MPHDNAYDERYVPTYIRLKNDLIERIQLLNIGDRLPSMGAMRKIYSVSQPTIDRALQELKTEGLVESFRGKGVFVTSRAKLKNIALCFGYDIDRTGASVFDRALLPALQTASHASHFALRYYMDDPAHGHDEHGTDQLQLDTRSHRIQGILGVAVDEASRRKKYSSLNLPKVILSDLPDFPYRVTLDYSPIIRLGVEALAWRRCRKIGLFSHSSISHPHMAAEESRAFAEALEKFCATSRPEWCYGWNATTSLELVGYAEFMRRWPTWRDKPDGIVCIDANVTTGILHAADALGVRIPENLKIATHSNRGVSDFGSADVTRIQFDVEKVARTMVEYLGSLLSAQPHEPRVVVVEPELV